MVRSIRACVYHHCESGRSLLISVSAWIRSIVKTIWWRLMCLKFQRPSQRSSSSIHSDVMLTRWSGVSSRYACSSPSRSLCANLSRLQHSRSCVRLLGGAGGWKKSVGPRGSIAGSRSVLQLQRNLVVITCPAGNRGARFSRNGHHLEF